MNLPIYQVDAFTDGPFTGNPAAVVPLDQWLPDETLQKIAEENNLSETAFFVKDGDGYHIRWMTPRVEVDLCGHATLASSHIIWEMLGHSKDVINLTCRIGALSVSRDQDVYTLNFPSDTLDPRPELVTKVADAIGMPVLEVLQGRNDLVALKGKDQYDFVSRGFFPLTGIDEDPATGSAHTTLTPYWASKLGKTTFKACQLSARRGHFACTLKGDRTLISGKAHLFLKGEIYI